MLHADGNVNLQIHENRERGVYVRHATELYMQVRCLHLLWWTCLLASPWFLPATCLSCMHVRAGPGRCHGGDASGLGAPFSGLHKYAPGMLIEFPQSRSPPLADGACLQT